MKSFSKIILICTLAWLSGCDIPEPADLIIDGGMIYTGNVNASIAEAVAVRNGVIIEIGESRDMRKYRSRSTNYVDVAGAFVYPGFIEGHAHIMGIGENKLNVDLMGTRSYDELVQAVAERARTTPKGEWILGRGWHQDKWESTPEKMIRGFPTHDRLSEAVPDHPVYLKHASGHAALANAKAMEIAGLNVSTPDPSGGEIFKGLNNQPTGILNETAQELVYEQIPTNDPDKMKMVLKLAIEECLANGITGFHQAGSDASDIGLFKEFAKSGDMKLRLYVMLDGKDDSLLTEYFEEGPYFDTMSNKLTIRSVKLYADGALGSRGAWLLDEYEDAPGKFGHNVTSLENIERITMLASQAGFQVCTHAIGDRGNREVLDIYEKAVKAFPGKLDDHRFRIEHAQHIDGDDIPRFAQLGVIPAMQAIHLSSDRPWAINRLGTDRIKEGAYVWRSLLESGAVIVNGTDAPVEAVSPLASFYASVSRRTLDGKPEGGYEPEQKMNRFEALRSYTLDAAYGAFEEDIKGSIAPGKFADFTILDRDIMTISEDEILKTKVLMTIVGGEVMFEK